MYFLSIIFLILAVNSMAYNQLTPEEIAVIEYKGTEKAFSGKYDNFYVNGFYSCRKCNKPLYKSMDKFKSGCGWPSFDDEIPNRVKRQQDADKTRTEIICNNCGGHLGHVFEGENITKKNTRHCVNSLSLKFNSLNIFLANPPPDNTKIGLIVVAGGCFWGVEYFFEHEPGVLATSPGYTGGTTSNPKYNEVCQGNTNHAEAVAVVFETEITDVKTLFKLFFSIHDPTQKNRQGPDIGSQYRSAIFVINEKQLKIAHDILKEYPKACTEITKLETFWQAEEKHRHYYRNQNLTPYCHFKK